MLQEFSTHRQQIEISTSNLKILVYPQNQDGTIPHPLIKINVDASVYSTDTSIGAVARYSDGRVMVALAQLLPRCTSVFAMEAQTFIHGIYLAQIYNFTPFY